MRRAIKCTCSHCLCETYFAATISALAALSSSTCARCGKTGILITMNIEAPKDAVLLDRIPEPECSPDRAIAG